MEQDKISLNFEAPVLELEKKIRELQAYSTESNVDVSGQIEELRLQAEKIKTKIFSSLSPMQTVMIARHPQRPYTLDYIKALTRDFIELHGDRFFSDDRALIGGPAEFEGRRVMIMGHQKGRNTKENLMRNFGCAHPEGYRKALRLMKLADKFDLPIICFVDTPGAYPGIGAEERGQASAIAVNLKEMFHIKVPIVVVVIGEGGSGGALGIGVGDRVMMLEHSYYSVISPEGCAAILWKDRAKTADAATVLKLTSRDLLKLGAIDSIIPEPLGGAHNDHQATFEAVRKGLDRSLRELEGVACNQLLALRYQKFRMMGEFSV